MLLLVLVLRCFAWNCIDDGPCGCNWAGGDELVYHVNADDIVSAEFAEILLAAGGWRAGAGQRVRGADWMFTAGSINTTDGIHGDGVNNVRKKDSSWFVAQGLPPNSPGATGVSHLVPTCVRNDADITFNSSATYTSDTPIVNPNETTKYSIGQSALHEFGHALGLDDAGWQIGTMNGNYPGGGDLGTGLKYRINEDDYVGLVAAKGDSSTGVNLMLLRFSYNTTNNLASEIWSNQTWAADKTENWEGHPGGSPSASNSPNDVYAVYVGTGSDNPVIKWRLSPDNICFSGTEYVIGSRTPGLSANDPYLVGPSGGFTIPSLTPPGLYYVCAMIDATFVVEETDENDNIIVSEKTFSVLP